MAPEELLDMVRSGILKKSHTGRFQARHGLRRDHWASSCPPSQPCIRFLFIREASQTLRRIQLLQAAILFVSIYAKAPAGSLVWPPCVRCEAPGGIYKLLAWTLLKTSFSARRARFLCSSSALLNTRQLGTTGVMA